MSEHDVVAEKADGGLWIHRYGNCLFFDAEGESELRKWFAANPPDTASEACQDCATLTGRLMEIQLERDKLRTELEQVNALARTLGYGQGELDSGLAECLQRSFDAMKAAASAEAQYANELQAELDALRTRAAEGEKVMTEAEMHLQGWELNSSLRQELRDAMRVQRENLFRARLAAVTPPAPSDTVEATAAIAAEKARQT